MNGKIDTKVNTKAIMMTFMVGAFFAILNETSMNIALTKLMDVFHVDAHTVQWLATSFLLVMGVLMPVSALLIQWFTTRQLYIAIMTIFLIGTVVAACAVNFPMLLVGRMLQAVGTAVSVPLTMNAVLLMYPPAIRGKIMGIFGIVIMFAPAAGTTLSGIVVDTLGWRWLFIIIIPFAIFIVLFAWKVLQNVGEVTRPRVDVLSILLSTIGIGGMIYGFSSMGEEVGTGSSSNIWIIIVISVLSLVAFVRRQLKLEQPLLDVRVFAYKEFSKGMVLFVIISMIMFSSQILLPMFGQGPLGYEAKTVGLLLLPGALLNGVLSPEIGILFDKYGSRKLIIPGTVLLIVTMVIYSTISSSIPAWAFILVYLALMLAIASIMMPSQTGALNQLPPHLYPHGTAMSNTLQPMAGALGVSVLVSIMTHGRTSFLEQAGLTHTKELVHEAMTYGIHHAYWLATALCCIGFVTALFLKKKTA